MPEGAEQLGHAGRLVDDLPATLDGEQVQAVARAEDRPALREDAGDVAAIEARDPAAARDEEPLEAVPDAEDLPAVDVLGGLDDRADHRVEAGAVAAAGQDRDAPRGLLRRRHGRAESIDA